MKSAAAHLGNRTRVATWLLLLAALGVRVQPAHAQLQGQVPIPPRQPEKQKRSKIRSGDLEWLWQYSPPPQDGRENDLIQDPHFRPFLEQYFTAPQSFWGSTTLDPRDHRRKSLADTASDFLTIPGKVVADDNRYVTITGHVFHFAPGRGLIFADLNTAHPLVLFAAIDWIRESHATSEPEAEYTLWVFPNQPPGTPSEPYRLPSAVLRSLTRWMAEPLAGSGIVQKITAAILVDPDGTPHQIPVPSEGKQ